MDQVRGEKVKFKVKTNTKGSGRMRMNDINTWSKAEGKIRN